jgi:sRNA-binding protein
MLGRRLTHGSLFSGVGGAELAAHWAGFSNLFHCEKGAVYLDLQAWENNGGASQYGDTHYVKQSLSKAEREKMAQLPEEQRKAQTQILGNMKPSEAQQQTPPPVTSNATVMGNPDDLPF